jgi:hypothetical protein
MADSSDLWNPPLLKSFYKWPQMPLRVIDYGIDCMVGGCPSSLDIPPWLADQSGWFHAPEPASRAWVAAWPLSAILLAG